MSDLKLGDRVRIKAHWNWPKDCTGIVAEPLPIAKSLAGEHPWRGHRRTVPGRNGPISLIWILFDEAQKDGDDDGPYRGGEVELEFVTKLDETA